jgi:hypothetical protein
VREETTIMEESDRRYDADNTRASAARSVPPDPAGESGQAADSVDTRDRGLPEMFNGALDEPGYGHGV